MIKVGLQSQKSEEQSDSMTPMIDVIFTLIAFMMLMINTPLLSLDMDLPEANKNTPVSAIDNHSVSVVILPDENHWRIDEGPVIGNLELKRALSRLQHQHGSAFRVVLRTDKTTWVQRLVDTVSLLNELKINSSQIAITNSDS